MARATLPAQPPPKWLLVAQLWRCGASALQVLLQRLSQARCSTKAKAVEGLRGEQIHLCPNRGWAPIPVSRFAGRKAAGMGRGNTKAPGPTRNQLQEHGSMFLGFNTFRETSRRNAMARPDPHRPEYGRVVRVVSMPLTKLWSILSVLAGNRLKVGQRRVPRKPKSSRANRTPMAAQVVITADTRAMSSRAGLQHPAPADEAVHQRCRANCACKRGTKSNCCSWLAPRLTLISISIPIRRQASSCASA